MLWESSKMEQATSVHAKLLGHFRARFQPWNGLKVSLARGSTTTACVVLTRV
jgi:hypothetical protein